VIFFEVFFEPKLTFCIAKVELRHCGRSLTLGEEKSGDEGGDHDRIRRRS